MGETMRCGWERSGRYRAGRSTSFGWLMAALIAFAGAVGCGGSDSTGGGDGASADGLDPDSGDGSSPFELDAKGEGTADNDGDMGSDSGSEDADSAVGDGQSECPEAKWGLPCNPGEKEFGWPCQENPECYSGFCIETAAGKVCADLCIENCPPGWTCSEVVVSGQDTQFICKPRFARLCDPCVAHTDCSDSGVVGAALCIDYGALGRYCGADCSNGKSCPTDYTCLEVDSPFGPSAKQCVPDSGECECSPAAIEKTLATNCTTTNGFGTCVGERFCVGSGLTDCDADLPGVEVCDGVDNNCNGMTDDITVAEACENSNPWGACPGVIDCDGSKANCIGPAPQQDLCDGLDNDCDGLTDEDYNDLDGDTIADCIDEDDDNDGILDAVDNCPVTPNTDQANFDGDAQGDACDDDDDNDGVIDINDCEPFNAAIKGGAPEICDGLDNDCNGLVDDGLCFDGNPCTNDVCDAASGCVYPPKAGPCDDGTVCTQNDVCSGGSCQGSQLNCDDGNPCTTDLCGATQGCYYQNNTAPCSDGNQCTENDTCQNGSCKAGPGKSCTDNNPCTNDSCNPSTGCVFNSAAMNGSLCDDDDPCTTQSVCSGGSCNGVKSYTCPPNPQCFLQTCLGLGDIPICICL